MQTLSRSFSEELENLGRDDVTSDTARLYDLEFSDLYLRLDAAAPSRFRALPNDRGWSGNLQLPTDYDDEVATLRSMIGKYDAEEGAFIYGGMRFRYRKAECVGSETWAALRRVPMNLPLLDQLGMAEGAVATMRQWAKRRGLVLIGGSTGAGKTTTAVAAVADVLERSSEVAVTVEDPPEYLMQGSMGQGVCFQFEVRAESDWAEKMRIALRWRPRVIMIGEIRTPDAAAQALRISTSGHLVVATVHGGSTEETLASVLRLAEVTLGAAARTMLADHLVGCLHQRLTRRGPEVSVLSAPVLMGQVDNVRKLIAEARFDKLKEYATAYAPEPAG